LLAASRVPAVFSFGSTMLVGILLAFFLAPLATRGKPSLSERSAHPTADPCNVGRLVR
jgi:predicted exporter